MHVDVICSNFLYLKQRFGLKKINAFLLINRNVVFDEKLNKRDLFSKKVFGKNEIDTKIFEKKNDVWKNDVWNSDTTLFLLIYFIDDTFCFIWLNHVFVSTLTLMCQFVYVFDFKCYRDEALNSIVQCMYYFRHENVVDIIQIKRNSLKLCLKNMKIFVFYAQNTKFVNNR